MDDGVRAVEEEVQRGASYVRRLPLRLGELRLWDSPAQAEDGAVEVDVLTASQLGMKSGADLKERDGMAQADFEVPIPRPPTPLGYPAPRIDWVGRPEQTNMRFNNPAMAGVDDLRDLWNQQTPFAISKELQPLFLQRLKDSFTDWDMRDGKADWTPEALAANANVFLDDFLLFDVAKPITDDSHLEIEKSTIDGRPYGTGGGRTVGANSIDILFTWLINHDREFLQGGATGLYESGHVPRAFRDSARTLAGAAADPLPGGYAQVWRGRYPTPASSAR